MLHVFQRDWRVFRSIYSYVISTSRFLNSYECPIPVCICLWSFSSWSCIQDSIFLDQILLHSCGGRSQEEVIKPPWRFLKSSSACFKACMSTEAFSKHCAINTEISRRLFILATNYIKMQRAWFVVLSIVLLFGILGCESKLPFKRSPTAKSRRQLSDDETPYTTYYYNQTLDHFDYNTKPLFFQQRYLVSGNSNIFFVTRQNNTGMVKDPFCSTLEMKVISHRFGITPVLWPLPCLQCLTVWSFLLVRRFI